MEIIARLLHQSVQALGERLTRPYSIRLRFLHLFEGITYGAADHSVLRVLQDRCEHPKSLRIVCIVSSSVSKVFQQRAVLAFRGKSTQVCEQTSTGDVVNLMSFQLILERKIITALEMYENTKEMSVIYEMVQSLLWGFHSEQRLEGHD